MDGTFRSDGWHHFVVHSTLLSKNDDKIFHFPVACAPRSYFSVPKWDLQDSGLGGARFIFVTEQVLYSHDDFTSLLMDSFLNPITELAGQAYFLSIKHFYA